MSILRKLIVTLVAGSGIFLAIRHGASALNPQLPKDMPSNAFFVQSGYNLQRNEPTGDWIACRPDNSADVEQAANLCRITDTHGAVIYQGDFVPLRGEQPVTAAQLRPAGNDSTKNMWIEGPSEGGPVPVIPLANGEILVPAADADALADRWARNPDELTRIEGL